MTLIATLEEVSGGTELTLILKKTCRQVPVEDNEAGSPVSLAQLVRRLE